MEGGGGVHAVVRAACDPGQVMQRIVEQAVALVPGADGAAVELLLEGELCYVCAAGSLADYVGTRLDPSRSLSGLAVRTGSTQRCDDSERDARVDRDACRRVGSTSMICVPLCRDDEPVGVLKVSSTRPQAFVARDVTMLGRLARFVTTTITSARELSAVAEDLFRVPVAGSRARVDERGMSTFVANVIHPGVAEGIASGARIRAVLRSRCLAAVLQPIIDLRTGVLAGAEALARFPIEPVRAPDVWFAEARRANLGVELQLEAVRRAIEAADALPTPAFLTINVDADAMSCAELPALLATAEPRSLVLELTEHVAIGDYPELRRVIARLRDDGARVAIDDTGAGYSSLAHIVKLAPEFIKLDIELVRGVDIDPIRRSLVTAVVTFARETGAKVVAEGIETETERQVLADLAVDYGQGYFLARPMPPEALRAWTGAERLEPLAADA
ncbi:MAG TPA: EAL domain-containing protein [Acidimicrobiales bacterium]|nr:EAL domain-containing protein [Acidimicrobiales bacterium]